MPDDEPAVAFTALLAGACLVSAGVVILVVVVVDAIEHWVRQ